MLPCHRPASSAMLLRALSSSSRQHRGRLRRSDTSCAGGNLLFPTRLQPHSLLVAVGAPLRLPSLPWSGDQRWAQKASVTTRAPPPPAGRARGRRRSERDKTWGRYSRQGVLNNTLVQTRVITSTPFPRGHLPSSSSLIPHATTVNSTWPRLGGNFLRLTLKSLYWTYDVLGYILCFLETTLLTVRTWPFELRSGTNLMRRNQWMITIHF